MYNIKRRIPKHQLAYYANRGLSPVEGWGFGKGGLFYKLPRIKGGMAKQDINTGKIIDELYEDYNVNTFEELIERIDQDVSLTDEQKRNMFLKEFIDNSVMYKDAKENNDDELKKEAKENMILLNEALGNLAKRNFSVFEDKDVQDLIQTLSHKKPAEQTIEELEKDLTEGAEKVNLDYQQNPHYDYANQKAKDKFERGDIVEDELDKNRYFLELIDEDKTPSYNTKDLDGYNPDFVKEMTRIITGDMTNDLDTLPDNIKNHFVNEMKDEFLKFVPVDIIKGNTIWEIKSFNIDIYKKGNQPMKYSKLDGYSGTFYRPLPDNEHIKGKYSYSFDYDKNANKIKNIYFNFDGKVKKFDKTLKKINFNVPVLKPNTNDYNYYWAFDNEKSFGYINPVKYMNAIKSKSYIGDDDKKYYEVDNKLIKKLPYTYTQILTDIRKRNKNLVSKGQYNKRLIRGVPKINKK